MKNVKIASLILCLMFGFCEKVLADATVGKCRVYNNGTVVSVWQFIDNLGNTVIEGAVGSVSTNPNTWTITTLSNGINNTQNSTPFLFSNANGDVVVLWQYPDANDNWFVAASMLPSGTSTWNSATISSNTESAGFFDQTASIDENGNILAMWSIYDTVNNVAKIRGATSTIGVATTWSSPVTVRQ